MISERVGFSSWMRAKRLPGVAPPRGHTKTGSWLRDVTRGTVPFLQFWSVEPSRNVIDCVRYSDGVSCQVSRLARRVRPSGSLKSERPFWHDGPSRRRAAPARARSRAAVSLAERGANRGPAAWVVAGTRARRAAAMTPGAWNFDRGDIGDSFSGAAWPGATRLA